MIAFFEWIDTTTVPVWAAVLLFFAFLGLLEAIGVVARAIARRSRRDGYIVAIAGEDLPADAAVTLEFEGGRAIARRAR